MPQSLAWHSVNDYKRSTDNRFVDFVPTGIFVGSHSDPSLTLGPEVVCLHNSTAVGQFFNAWGATYDERLSEYGDSGVEHGRLVEAREHLNCLESDYKELESETNVCEEECESNPNNVCEKECESNPNECFEG
eukprot:gnl/MRDRNA2_/MRDRNA2_266249_c0_seq1.p1 gnl/MRDRNA2_/MRDRNA2_266249_c0~~gnl/MRDRNA2_/MRDRNA2_266249_c0_seq1.p1  ORF type:complete len:141 (+),score=26.97 gnl/MRDRNA2_/MRDRNA2_266249_c0_seq1:26-424(+)